MINILAFDSSTTKLNDGFTLNDYIIRANADKVSYDKLCDKLHITFEEAKESYDKTWNLPIEAIGVTLPPKLISAKPKPSRLQYRKYRWKV